MLVLKIQKQSPWGVLWKGVPKNYPKFTRKHLYQSLYSLEACNFIKKTSTKAYFKHLLRAVPAHNGLFQFLRAFSHSRNLEFACYLGGFIFKFVFFLFILHTYPAFLKYALLTQTFCEELCNFFKNTYFVEQLQTAASEKSISCICSFNQRFLYLLIILLK